VREFLARHSNVEFHFTPTYSSWLNQVEISFSKLQRDVIDRGIFTSVADLGRKIMPTSGCMEKPPSHFDGNTPTSATAPPHDKDSERTAH
jgi:transposase